MRATKDTQRILLAVILALPMLISIPARSQPEPGPIAGFEVGPQMDTIVPGQFIVDPPTIENLGFRWYVAGDSNRNASVTVEFRKLGQSHWRQALPMLRVHHEVVNQVYGPYRTGNLFAGSVLFLEPETTYEVRFTMSDPDGGAPVESKVVEATTRHEPRAFEQGRTIPVSSAQELVGGFRRARPGDIFLLAPGVYKGPFDFDKSGTAEKPIVIRGPAEGEAILEGDGVDSRSRIVTLNGTHHLHFEGLTFRSAQMAVYVAKPGGSEGLVIRGCRIYDVVYGINTGCPNSKNWYIADNDIVGINPTWYPRDPKTYMQPGHTGINIYGQGHVICYNRITRFSDSAAIYNFGPPPDDVAMHCVNIDFYNNDLSWAQDDTFEADYGCHNVRFYRNRCYNAHTGMSTQPFYGGPVYLIRNELYGITSLSYKLNNYPAGIEAYNNTSCCAGSGFRPPPIWQNGHFRNNLFMGGSGYALTSGSPTAYSTMDYNAYRRNEPDRLVNWKDHEGSVGRYKTLEAFSRVTGLEQHGMLVDYDVFVDAGPPVKGKTCEPGGYNLALRADSEVIDVGIVLPQITDDFTGTAPDLGCYELDREPPHYGPRF